MMADDAARRATLAQTFDHYAAMLANVANIGATWDARDLYWVLEQVTQATLDAHPDFLCRVGCVYCCYGDSIPIVTSAEWRLLYQHLVDLPDGIRRLIVRQVKEQWAPHLVALLPGKAGYQDERGEMHILPKAVAETIHCPLLAYNKCSVYLTRPFACRTYGHFTRQYPQSSSYFMCGHASEHIERTFPEDAALPVINGFEAKLAELEGSPPVLAMLPLWVAAHIEGMDFSQVCNLQPDFAAVAQRFQTATSPPRRL